ncbi:MAG: PAS domain-containing protein [Bordetella sp.]|uniref:PAS domain-containing protein n=1 Tax=Bordetella sp. TaxID=28081 RepID=UPI003F7CCBB9
MTQPIHAGRAVDAKRFSNIDRRMALAFGLVIFCLMLAVLLAGGWYVRGIMQQDQNRLSAITTQILSDAVGRISFSGKYHVRLFLQQVRKERPDIAYLRLLDQQGNVVADSYANDKERLLNNDTQTSLEPLLAGRTSLLARDLQEPDGTLVHEVSAQYRGGFNNEDQGVIQIGILETAMQDAWHKAVLATISMLFVLLLIGIAVTYRISAYFGRPVRRLAADMDRERQRLANILASMQAGTWEWNMQTGEVTLNERWAAIAGYTLAELQPIDIQTFIKLCHPADLAVNNERLKAHLSGKEDFYVSEIRMRHKNGHWVWVLDSGCVFQRDASGAPLIMMGARQDITERKHAEESLRSESARFMELARVSNTGVWEWDKANSCLWSSPEYFSMLGLNPQDYAAPGSITLQNAWIDLLHPDDIEQARQSFAQYLADEPSHMYETEFRMRHANGSWVWILSRGSILRDANGKSTGKMLGTHIDATSLKNALAQLRDSQEQLRRISDNLPDSTVYQIDCGGPHGPRRFTYLSEGIQRVHGLAVEDVMRDPSLLYDQMNPEDLVLMRALESECIANMTDFKAETRCTLPDGRQCWILITSSPRKMSNGHVVFDGLSIDITEQKQQEERIHELNTQLEQRVQERTLKLSSALDGLRRTQKELLQSEKLASLGALVAGVAHELNTPIGTAVTVASTLVQTHKRFKALTETGLTRSALAEYLNDVQEGGLIIERNLERAAELLGGFKQLAVDQTSYQRRSFSVHEVVQEIMLSMRPTLRKTKFELVTDIPRDLVMDSLPGPLGQVLINLINNALVHAFGDRDTGTISLGARATDPGWLSVTVRDDGRGIPQEHQSKIFDPFFTTKMGQGGSGLGLHITYTLVTGPLGGRIELHSAPGQGTSFVLHLPLAAPTFATESVDEAQA